MDDRQITMNCHVVAKDGCVGVGSLVHRYEWQLCLFPQEPGRQDSAPFMPFAAPIA